jgi:hypothetical protein
VFGSVKTNDLKYTSKARSFTFTGQDGPGGLVQDVIGQSNAQTFPVRLQIHLTRQAHLPAGNHHPHREEYLPREGCGAVRLE